MIALDRWIKIGPVTLPRFLIAKGLDDEFDDDLYLVHMSEPRFCARWQIGEEGGVAIKPLVWTDSDEEEPLYIYDFVWLDDFPDEKDFDRLMAAAAEWIQLWINERADLWALEEAALGGYGDDDEDEDEDEADADADEEPR
jgi:hypothetical protein